MESHTPTSATLPSPFHLRPQDVQALQASEGFQVIRTYLANCGDNAFCEAHADADEETLRTYLFHRDILHALVMPVVQLYCRATSLASAALCSSSPEDHELAFHSAGRSAFLFLQCFLSSPDSDEVNWAHTHGCPGCVVSDTLSTESHIRLTLAAIHLSTSAAAGADEEKLLTLPSFAFFEPVLRDAIAQDPFWGPDYIPHLVSRAETLSSGLEALIAQCSELEALVASPVQSPMMPASPQLQAVRGLGPDALPQKQVGMRVKRSRLAKRQGRLEHEEQALLQRLVWQCCGAASIPADVRNAIKSGILPGAMRSGQNFRLRSFTT